MGNGLVTTTRIFNGEALTASGSALSDEIDLRQFRPDGSATVQVAVTGDGTFKIEWLGSNDGKNFVTPDSVAEIATGLTKTPGNEIYAFTISQVKFIKFKITETGTSDPVTVTLDLTV